MFCSFSNYRFQVSVFVVTLLVIITLFSGNARANQHPKINGLHDNVIVADIEIIGLRKTKPKVVLRELLFKKDHSISAEMLIESIQRIKNTELFSEVLSDIQLQPDGTAKLVITVKEKWTAIPYLNFRSGGGTEKITAGFYDINIAGRFIQSGVQYENWNGEHSGAVWLEDPRFLNRRIIISTSYISTKKPRRLYLDSGVKTGSYVLARNLFRLSLEKKYESGLSSGAAIELYEDKFLAPESTSLLDNRTFFQITDSSKKKTNLYRLKIKYGRTDYDNFLFSGGESSLIFKHTMFTEDSAEKFYSVDFRNLYYKHLPHMGNLALQARAGITNTQQLQHQFSAGGFQHVRGYFDGQFRGRAYWQLNVEYRIPSYRHKLAILQHNFFVDVTEMKNNYSEISFDKESLKFSAGLGLRFIIPWIYRSVGRIDYAVLRGSSQSSRIALGVRQFF